MRGRRIAGIITLGCTLGLPWLLLKESPLATFVPPAEEQVRAEVGQKVLPTFAGVARTASTAKLYLAVKVLL